MLLLLLLLLPLRLLLLLLLLLPLLLLYSFVPPSFIPSILFIYLQTTRFFRAPHRNWIS